MPVVVANELDQGELATEIVSQALHFTGVETLHVRSIIRIAVAMALECFEQHDA